MSTNLTAPSSESIVVEAPTVEAALEAVVQQMGTGCRILGVEKASRGGIAGFFGKETFQVEVALPNEPSSLDSRPAHRQAHESVHAAQAAVDRVLEASGLGTGPGNDEMAEHASTFGELLRARVGSSPGPTHGRGETPETADIIDLTEQGEPGVAHPLDVDALHRLREAIATGRQRDEDATNRAAFPVEPVPAEELDDVTPDVVSEDQSVPEHDDGSTIYRGTPLFTSDHLVRMGLPFSFVAGLGDLSCLGDTGRLISLADALEPWCAPPTTNEPELVLGTAVGRLGDLLRLPVYGADSIPEKDGDAGWMVDPNDPSTWAMLDQVRAGRALHVIDPSPHVLASLEPGATVSWTDERIGFESVLFALERGLRLGFDLTGRVARDASALDVAIAIRARLPVTR